ncbi:MULTISPECIES: hypothetical protein [Streptomyces]|uniref:hypothetical protein n=1 Tax=Streptomyces TaxID=1883 RepID=UPI00131B62AC|nr:MULTISPECIES: hypothetical protein [Streptomyces]MDI5912420.1 hypothetical protein [Streptomyces sp. 12257]
MLPRKDHGGRRAPPAGSSRNPSPPALAGDDPATAKLIAGSILPAIHAFTDADNQDALTLLRALRNEVLRAG